MPHGGHTLCPGSNHYRNPSLIASTLPRTTATPCCNRGAPMTPPGKSSVSPELPPPPREGAAHRPARDRQDVARTPARRIDVDVRAVLDALPRAVVVSDNEGRILLWNAGAERLYGWNE